MLAKKLLNLVAIREGSEPVVIWMSFLSWFPRAFQRPHFFVKDRRTKIMSILLLFKQKNVVCNNDQ